ncbi:ATP-binding cassette domain-containing protein [Paenibacillus arenilitoris]|uniref:ATP-binding cassette domain-containing protein n=1 Tax=Paenibacillus arenilitoris TaxID=2772299 RepID=A0A927H698_9BACL|nr:ATP-binding cassette domain-containing protein [Paenibacillus arenilitoris]MBD2869282.1 ATP-binding cassette domain-containing protein [Paenibacillus arenilitoris]
MDLQKKFHTNNLFINGFGFLLVGVFFVSTSISVYNSEASIGAFAGLVSFLAQLTPMINNVGSTLKSFNINKNNINELLSFYQEYETNRMYAKNVKIQQPSSGGLIRLENVSFMFPNSEKYILHNVNLEIHPGETLAIVGLIGAGKTTLANIIAGFYEPTEGRIYINGVDYPPLSE